MFQVILILTDDEPAAGTGHSKRFDFSHVMFRGCTVFLRNDYYVILYIFGFELTSLFQMKDLKPPPPRMSQQPLLGPGLPYYRDVTITQTKHTRSDSSGRVIGPSQKTTRQRTICTRDIHSPVGIRTRYPSMPAVADTRLRPRGSWCRPQLEDLKQ
jgi:hypothetical protein